MTFSIITLGCKVNSCESAAIHAAFLAAGYSPAEEDSHADVYIINSCAVTGVGVKKARQTVSHCKTLNPDGITVLLAENSAAVDTFSIGTASLEEVFRMVVGANAD